MQNRVAAYSRAPAGQSRVLGRRRAASGSGSLLDHPRGVRKGTPHTPLAQKTTLGWILSGGCGGMAPHGPRSSLQCSADNELNELVRHFWEQEREQPTPVPLSPQEEECENLFARTHERTATGRHGSIAFLCHANYACRDPPTSPSSASFHGAKI